MAKIQYFAETQQEIDEITKKFTGWIQRHGGIDVYMCQDLSQANQRFFVPKGSGRPHWSAETAPSRMIGNLDNDVEFILNEKVLHGIHRDDDGRITNIDLSDDDPDCGRINLRNLTRKDAEQLDNAFFEFFQTKGEEQGKAAAPNDGGHGVIPWGRGLHWGETAYKLDDLTNGIPGMAGGYLDALWEAYEDALCDGLIVRGDPGSGDSWSIERLSAMDCSRCGSTLTESDVECGFCPDCGEEIKVEDEDEAEEADEVEDKPRSET